jgi:hypothetical protein
MFLTKNEGTDIPLVHGRSRGLQVFIGHTNNSMSPFFFEKTVRQ